MVLLPLIRTRVDVPVIAAGGISDGLSMAAAFALGAEGVQMGTRMLSCLESPVRQLEAGRGGGKGNGYRISQPAVAPGPAALRTRRTAALEPLGKFNVMENMAGIPALYFGGDMEAAIPLSGQVCGRIDDILSARQIIDETIAGFHEVVRDLAQRYPA